MAEAKKMMENPSWQKEMKKLAKSKDFKDSIKKTKDLASDPNTAAHAEARMEHMLKVGDKELKQGAMSAMEEAMSAMSNPEVMAEMSKMIKDPNFAKQFQDMSKDPSFQKYVDAVSYHSIFVSLAVELTGDINMTYVFALLTPLYFFLVRTDGRHDERPCQKAKGGSRCRRRPQPIVTSKYLEEI